jgi:PTH1 family peptidyl-tRNA hydrolase
MFLIVGLGNPGKKYEHTRHNVGFDALDILSDMWKLSVDKSRNKATVGEGSVYGQRVALAKPQTFMNDSGLSVVQLLGWYKTPIENMMVVVDDIDLPLGAVRMRKQGSAGTHNGMRSIIRLTGKDAFPRVRVGIGKPEHPQHNLKDYVLTQYRKEELVPMFNALKRAALGIDLWVREGIDVAMQETNTKNPEKLEKPEKPTESNSEK